MWQYCFKTRLLPPDEVVQLFVADRVKKNSRSNRIWHWENLTLNEFSFAGEPDLYRVRDEGAVSVVEVRRQRP